MNNFLVKRRMPGIGIIALALAAIVFAAACSKSSNSTNSSNNSSSSNASNANKTSPTPSTASLSPTAVFNAYYEAVVKKDVAAIKKYYSQGSLKMLEEAAKRMGTTLDEMLGQIPNEGKPQLGAEKITGDTATVEITIDGKLHSLPFVKEGGEWKIAADKMAQMEGPPGGPEGDDETNTNTDDEHGDH